MDKRDEWEKGQQAPKYLFTVDALVLKILLCFISAIEDLLL